MIFPFTLAEANKKIKLDNGDKIKEGSSIYIINYTDNEQYEEESYKCIYTIDDKFAIGKISLKDIQNKLTVSPEIVRTINTNGEDWEKISTYGYGKTAFKTNKAIKVEDPILGEAITIPKDVIVTGFLYKDGEKQEVLFTYKDPNTQDFVVDAQDSKLFLNDMSESKEDKELQLIESIELDFDCPASNGQVIIKKGTSVDLYLSKRQMLLASDDGLIYEISSQEIPYISKAIEQIFIKYPELKEYFELSLFINEKLEDESKEKTVEQQVEQPQQPVEQPVVQPVEQPVEQLVEQPQQQAEPQQQPVEENILEENIQVEEGIEYE